MKILLAGLIGVAAGSLGAAEGEKAEVTEVKAGSPQVVVTATRVETESWKTAASVHVIGRVRIEEQQYRLLPDALREVPGLTLADRGSPGVVTGVFLRGTKTEHTAVLIDGRPVPMNLAGAFNLETMPLDNVERVEVLRGPASSLYGGKTIGGVINIITRSGKGLEKPRTTVFHEAGSYGTFREGVSTLGAAGDLDWAFDASRTDVQGHRINSQFQMSNAAGKIGYDLGDSLRFDLDLRYYNADVGIPGAATGFGSNDPDDHLLTEYWSISPRLVWETTERWRQTLTFSTTNFRQAATTPNNPFPQNNRITIRNQFLEYQSEFRPTELWTIVAGLWLQDQSFTRYNDDLGGYDVNEAETNAAAYLQTQAEVLPGLNLQGGARLDHYSDYGDEVTWRGGVSYRVPVTRTLVHGNYGTAFSPPSPQDRQPALFGNPGLLLPEKSRGIEVGVEQPFAADKASVSVTWFRNDIRNLIEFDPSLFVLQQIDKARTQGVEVALQWQPHERAGFDLAYAYLDADNLGDQTRLVRRPRHTLNGGLWVRPVEKVRLGLSARYVIDREDGFGAGQRDIEDYLNVRLTASWQVCRWCEVFARVENLFGERYEEVLGYPAYGTAAYAG
ncbi:MAG TPA: TonB-dependent receptor, partial [Prosthecobacter sp.]|nr:TonB-dependent receptor [Prosthecobacter sp.]